MSKIWQTIRGYIWWTHPRGNMHYDVMVTLILAFIFLTPPRLFNDKPTERIPYQGGAVVLTDGDNLIYQIDASAVQSKTDVPIQDRLLRAVEPFAGEAVVTRYEALADSHGNVKTYKVWVKKPYR